MKIAMSLFIIIVLAACDEIDIKEEKSTTEVDPASTEVEEKTQLEATVTYIVDGDTFDVEFENGDIERVRPILVDAPEVCHQSSPSDCEPDPFGEEATEFTKELLEGQTVYLKQDVSERDRYDRMLFYVFLEDGRMYQELILAEGLAEIAIFEPDTLYLNELEGYQEEAQKNEINMWSN